MGNFTGKLSNNFAHALAVSSRPPCWGLVKEANSEVHQTLFQKRGWKLKLQFTYLQMFDNSNPRTVLEVAINLQPHNILPATFVGECPSDFFVIEGTNWATSFQNRFQTISTEAMTTICLYRVTHHKETYRTLILLFMQRACKFSFKTRHYYQK